MVNAGPVSIAVPIKLDPVSLVVHASGPVFVVVWGLVLAALVVWVITVLKLLQLSRLLKSERAFEKEAALANQPEELFYAAQRHPAAPGSRVVLEIAKRIGNPKLLESVAKRAIVAEQQRA